MSAATEEYRRKQEEKDRRQADHTLAQIVSARIGIGNAIREGQRHPLAHTTLRFLELAKEALDAAEITCREELAQ